MFMCLPVPNIDQNHLQVFTLMLVVIKITWTFQIKTNFCQKPITLKKMTKQGVHQNSFSYLKPASSPAGIIFLVLLNLTPMIVARKKAVTRNHTSP